MQTDTDRFQNDERGTPKGGRRQWTAEERADHLALFEASGLSVAQFCREMGFAEATFYQWRRDQHTPRAPQPSHGAVRFAPVELIDEPREDADVSGVALSTMATRSPATAHVVSAAAAMHIRLPNGVETRLVGLDAAATLAVLEGLVRTCCPSCPCSR